MDAMSVVLIIYMLTQRFTNKTQFLPIRWPLAGYLEALFISLWLTVIAIGLIGSPRIIELMSEWKWIFNLYFMYWFLIYYWKAHGNKDETGPTLAPLSFWQPLLWILLACFTYGAISYLTGVDQFKQLPLTHGKRFAGPFDDPMNFAHIYGMYFVFLIPFAIDCLTPLKNLRTFKQTLKDKKQILLFIVTLAIGLSVALSLTRGAWIGVFVATIVIFFTLNWRWGLSALAIGLIAALILYATSDTFQTRVNQAINPSQSYDNERINLWQANWAIFLDHPVVGIGHGEYKKYLPIYFEKLGIPADHFQSHAHNQYLQFLSNTGLLGLLFYLIFIGYLLIKTYQGYRASKDPVLLGCLAAQVAFHIGAVTECNFERAKVRLVFLFFSALAMSLITVRRKTTFSDQI